MSAEGMRDKIGYHQGSEFLHSLEKAGLTVDKVQRVITSPDIVRRGNTMAKAMMAGLHGFHLLTTIDLVVPSDYVHATQLTTFRKEHESEFDYYDNDITDEHFPNPSVILTPGQKLQVKIFHLTKTMTSKDLLAFLKKQKARLVGAQGLSLLCQLAKAQLPKGYCHISLDEKDRLWQVSAGLHLVSLVVAYSDGSFAFDLGRFVNTRDGDICVLCFCDSE